VPVFVVSDLHGAHDALKRSLPAGATLLLLGDLINFIDYFSMSGILTEVFSRATVTEVVRLRTEGRLDEARLVMSKRAEGREDEIRSQIATKMESQYREIFSALPRPTYLILGNVDHPRIVTSLVSDLQGIENADGSVVEIDGERFGFIGGALPTPLHVAGEIPEAEMRAKVQGLGNCDVLCSHIPPAVPELCYDTIARRQERGSRDLLDYIQRVQPQRAYFGHIHQPLVSSLRVGRTLCVNVGYFRATQRPWPHLSDDERSP
jgi:Icc-related predicted phosphoesterase